jgi:site-specific recombinase XerD
MLKAIDDTENVKSLLDVKLVRNIFLKSYVENKKYEAGTIKSYLMSLHHFCSFLISDRPDGIQFNNDDVNATREKVKLWSVSYKREANTRKWQKLEEDTINRLTPENIRKFEKSDMAREAIKIIGCHSDTTQTTLVTQRSYTLVRDFLFTQTLIDNANRPGVLAHMTMQEYNRMHEQDDHYVITVMKHKTAYVHVPPRIVLNAKLKSWFSIFVEVMRPQITSATSGNVFLSWNGKPMISGHITKAIQSLFKKSGIEMKITSTSFRKAAVTRVHSDQPNLSGKLAALMAHNEATAKKYYRLTEKSKESVEVSKQLGKLMRSNDVTESGPLSDSEVGKEGMVPQSSAGDHSSLPNLAKQGSEKTPWSNEDAQKISEVFKDEISKKTISLDTVRNCIEMSEELRGM